MGKMDAVKRILVLQLVTIEFLLDVAGYAFFWFFKYKGLVEVQFWQKGDALVIVIYAAILLAFFLAYGAGKIGYLRSFEIFLSKAFSILATNLISYAQLSLMTGKLITPKFILALMAAQLAAVYSRPETCFLYAGKDRLMKLLRNSIPEKTVL